MKTSELRQAIRNLGFDFKETDEYILVSEAIRIFKREQRFNVIGSAIYGYEKIMLLKLAIEYTETPLEEREEEKKYCFKFCDKLGKNDGKRYLNLNITNNVFFFSSDWFDLEDLESGNLRVKGEFAQSEIDNFPAEIKGAIECGFLKKVEVE